MRGPIEQRAPSGTDVLNPFLDVLSPQWFLIITPDEFLLPVRRLAYHKNGTGMPTTVVSLSSLKPFFEGADDPEVVKRAIQYAHENLETKYVMLVGDAHWFPVRWYFIHNSPDLSAFTRHGITLARPQGDWFVSDLYYANLYHYTYHPEADRPLVRGAFDNWDGNGNGLYNEAGTREDPNPDNVSGYPDLAVARLPAHSVADVEAYVSKVITYETTPRGREFTFVHDWNYGWLQWTTDLASQVGKFATRTLLIDRVFKTADAPNPTQMAPIGWIDATGQDVAHAASLSNWVSYIGHGWNTQWGNALGPGEVQTTSTSSALPVVFASGCQTGQFITDVPWNSNYRDVSGAIRGRFLIPAQDTLEPLTQQGPLGVAVFDGPLIVEVETGRRWGVNCPGCEPLPAPIPTPSPYDYDRGDQGFAHPWLIGAAPGGAIAYFGEMGIAQDQWGYYLERYLLEDYMQAPNPILGDLFLNAQQQYWPDHRDDGFQSGSRFFLGWMAFFGDPSLRLPSLTKDPKEPPVPKVG